YGSGRVGVTREARVRARGQVTRLELADPCSVLTPHVAGLERFVTVSDDVAQRFETQPDAVPPFVPIDDLGAQTVLRTTTEGIQRLRCKDVPIASFRAMTP